jgi:hypothetical protein
MLRVDQVALHIADNVRPHALALLADLGLTEWVTDIARAEGTVGEESATNAAELSFNYDFFRNDGKPVEFELLRPVEGPCWLSHTDVTGQALDSPFRPASSVSHFGFHVDNDEELAKVDETMRRYGILCAQDVTTTSHTNPGTVGRRYRYKIYRTRRILGVDLKFIRRLEA